MTTTALIAELSDLLDASADEPATKPGGVHDSSRGMNGANGPPTALAPLRLAIAPATPHDAPSTDARTAANEALLDDVMLAVRDAVRVLRRTFEENNADFDDACKALPLLHRVLEHTDKMKVAARAPPVGPMLNFTIVLDDTPQEAPPGRRPPRAALPIVEIIQPE